MKTIALPLLALVVVSLSPLIEARGEVPKRPFPQAAFVNSTGLRPNTVSQSQMDAAVLSFWSTWKAKYLKPSVAVSGDYKVDYNNTGTTVSEAMGYGMLLSAYMAGADPQAKTYFDGLNRFRKRYPSVGNPALMNWRVFGNEVNTPSNCATDGDLDIVMALFLAHAQWGDADYLGEANTLLQAIRTSLVRADDTLRLGDWDNVAGRTRPSDAMTAFFRSFYHITGDSFWASVEAKAYEIMEHLQTVHSPSTGILPDFAMLSGGAWQPANPYFLESANDGKYYYNACRIPWRVGWAGVAFGTEAAQRISQRFMDWVTTNHAAPVNFRAGYGLDGSNISGNNYPTAAFIAPTGVAAMLTGHQSWLNATFADASTRREQYYEDSILIPLMSGSFFRTQTGVSAHLELCKHALRLGVAGG